jgi:hypothetical protein
MAAGASDGSAVVPGIGGRRGDRFPVAGDVSGELSRLHGNASKL